MKTRPRKVRFLTDIDLGSKEHSDTAAISGHDMAQSKETAIEPESLTDAIQIRTGGIRSVLYAFGYRYNVVRREFYEGKNEKTIACDALRGVSSAGGYVQLRYTCHGDISAAFRAGYQRYPAGASAGICAGACRIC